MNNNLIIKLKFWKIKKENLPLLILIITILILGILIFDHVSLSQQFPFGDALTYAQKAKNFWDTTHKFRWFEPQTWFFPLNIEPTVRPPGTILMSYPFGFSDNPHGFFFRSIFIPIILFIAALWIIAKPYCITLKDQWLLVALCIAFGTLPLFYHFEPSIESSIISPTYWGLVDNFIASVAALATALVIRGVQQTSIGFTFSGIITSTFCLFIKPSGGLIMLAILLVWAINGIAKYRWQQNIIHKFRKYLIITIFTFIFVYAIGFFLALKSHYFSTENMIYGKKAVEILKQESHISIQESLLLLNIQIHTSFGWHCLAVILLTCVFSFLAIDKQVHNKSVQLLPVNLIGALGVLLLGLWFWLVQTEQSQIRYFFPFSLMCIVLLLPTIKNLYSKIHDKYWPIIIASLIFPMLLLLLMLFNNNQPTYLQRFLGVNLTSGSLINEIQQAKLLIEDAKNKKHDYTVYPFGYANEIFVFESVGLYEKVLHPNLKSFSFKSPVTWINPSTFRLSEIISSDYLLLAKPIESSFVANKIMDNVEVPDFASEIKLFHAWLSTINYNDAGLAIESQTSLRLLKVIDHTKLDMALNQLKSKHKWRKVFLDANPVKWIDSETAKVLIARSNTSLQNIRFGNEFILLGALTTHTEDGLTIELVWESLQDQPLKYINFVHILDSSKNITGQADYEQDSAQRLVSKGTIWHDIIKIPNHKLNAAKEIGIGVYIPPDKFLIADHGLRDWNNYRLIFKLDQK
jgi:hypothetical protein